MKIDWIEPGVLAASGIPVGVQDLQSLKAQGIAAIVSLTEYPLTAFHLRLLDVAEDAAITPETFGELDIIYQHAPIPDGFPPDLDTAQKTMEFIDQMAKQRRATLIHCAHGVGRTGTMLHYYYLAHGFDLAQAKEKVKSRRAVSQYIFLSEQQRIFLTNFAASQLSNQS